MEKKKLKEKRDTNINNQINQFNTDGDNDNDDKENHDQDKNKKVSKQMDTYSPKEVDRAAEFASKVIGVNKDYLMGILTVETNLGQNVGKCTYGEVESDAEKRYQNGSLSATSWNTFEERRDQFQDIAQTLGYDYEKMKVSCNPYYAGTGGAMGVEQFMPSTWLEYKDRIAQVTNKDNPDPWDAKDGVVAMALKLSDVYGVTQHNIWSERAAAKIYLSGTTSIRYEWYANQAIYWSRNYRVLLAEADANSNSDNS